MQGDPGCLDDLHRDAQAEQERNQPHAPIQATPDAPDSPTSVIDDISIALKFISALKAATLDSTSEPLDPELLHQIRNPATEKLTVDDPDDRLSIDTFLAIGNASEASYSAVRTAILRRHPESNLLSYFKVKRLVADLTGVTA